MAYVIDQINCTCCHRCRVECPADAIRFKNSKYWIDPEKCVDCGHCVEVCHNEIITNPDKPEPAPIPHERIKKSCDVVVIGGGGSGTVAAARAAALGAKVILLEKNHEVGGSAWYAHMFRTHYSKWHKEAGMADERDKTYEKFMKKTEGKVDGKLFRRILDANVDFVDWLIADHELGKDFVFGKNGPFGMGLVSTYLEEYNTKRIDTSIGPGGTGWYMALKTQKILLENGGEILFKTAGKELITDASGKVVGVIASDPGGEIEISCKACIVAAGSFSRSRELMSKFQPMFYDDEGKEPVHVFTHSMCTGDGITMCDKLGADIDYVNKRVNFFGPRHHPYPCVSLAASGSRSGILVNKFGELVEMKMEMDEVSPFTKQPGWYGWSIVDSKAVESEITNSIGRTKDVVGIPLDEHYRNWKQWLAVEEEDGGCYSADTLEELGAKIGVDPKAFAATVKAHNEKVIAEAAQMPPGGGMPPMDEMPPMGEMDEGMGMMPPMMPSEPIAAAPYYAFHQKLFHENAMGGMTIDEHLSVLKQGKPIPGLYAAGDNTRGIMLPGKIGVAYIESIISALTFAISSGFAAGEEAVKFIKA